MPPRGARITNKAIAMSLALDVPIEQLPDKLRELLAGGPGPARASKRGLAKWFSEEHGIPVDHAWILRYLRDNPPADQQ